MYDSNEYHMFRLPSEKSFLFSDFDYNDLFGQRKGTNHSPHIRAQMNLDSNIVWFMAISSIVLMLRELKRSHDMVTLRKNLVNSDMGWFKEEDFN